MKVNIEIECGNAAFDEGNSGNEVARILRKLAEKLDEATLEDSSTIPLHDINGNRVGAFEVR